jgi:hypothetical protein
VVDWIIQTIAELEIATLSDVELLAQCDAKLAVDLQDELSGLLSDAREGNLADSARARLDDLMAIYRRGMVRKAIPWKEAMARGLRTSVADAEADADHAA